MAVDSGTRNDHEEEWGATEDWEGDDWGRIEEVGKGTGPGKAFRGECYGCGKWGHSAKQMRRVLQLRNPRAFSKILPNPQRKRVRKQLQRERTMNKWRKRHLERERQEHCRRGGGRRRRGSRTIAGHGRNLDGDDQETKEDPETKGNSDEGTKIDDLETTRVSRKMGTRGTNK